MDYSTNQLNELRKMLFWKKSKKYYAKRLKCSIEQIDKMIAHLRGGDHTKSISSPQKSSAVFYKTPPTVEDIIRDHKIDTSKFEVNNLYVKQNKNGYHATVSIKPLKKEVEITSQFLDFLKSYKPPKFTIESKFTIDPALNTGCLIINKQDAHLNKLDEFTDNNSILERSTELMREIASTVKQASKLSNIDTIIYTIGSDEYNSEWTDTTTRGTPQKNIGSYHSSFTAICNFESFAINYLAQYCNKLQVIYIPGNHDEYVGWHLAMYLKALFRDQTNITIDSDNSYTKYVRWRDSALCFNHGYGPKPEQLADSFPANFKKEWSFCNNFYIFLGDKHTELSKTVGNIEIYRLTQSSTAKSKWDMLNDYSIHDAKLTSFLLEEKQGITNIFKRKINGHLS